MGLAGCAALDFDRQMAGPSYIPANVYRSRETLGPAIKRVAVLPLTSLTEASEAEFGRETLAPILRSELAKAQRFELVTVSPEQLQRLTGRSDWTGHEQLPWNFFSRLRETTACEAVLFSQLTHYRPFRPLMIGWQLKLVDVAEPRVLWSVDEVFDASSRAVVRAAWRYASGDPRPGQVRGDALAVLTSPRFFGQYTASALMATLPKR